MFPLKVLSMSELISSKTVILYIWIAVINAVLLIYASHKYILAFQQLGYRNRRYFNWLRKKNIHYSRLMLLSLLGLLFFLLLNVCFTSIVGENYTVYMGFISYLFFYFLYINTERKTIEKMKLKVTKRIVRLGVVFVIIITAFTFGVLLLSDLLAYLIKVEVFCILRYAIVCFIPLLIPHLLLLANVILLPFEILNNRRYIKRTKEKLEKADIIKIGITGSYGKTTVKNILTTLLSQKYRVLATPESYNTPLGIALTTKKLDSTHDVFIAEMGARQVGDISDLATIVKPKYAILTGVNTQHLETFKTKENIIKTKFELFENLPPDGVGFFSCDNQHSKEMFNDFKGEKYLAGVNSENSTVFAENIKVTPWGTNFDLNIAGKKVKGCHTNLLGEHNISNICLASLVAYKLGVSLKDIGFGINRLTTVKHRLEIVPNNHGVTIIDDSYNSNENGFMAALSVLSSFEGRKIVLTPGLVELGLEENIANYNFGIELAKKADIVIIIGSHNAEMLISGLIDGGFLRSNIIFAKNLQKGNLKLNEIMREGDVILFENDLPDTY
ncbi:MAG: UDP-N-acetylmuramoyl-tripeptide--D-alanyl-D-alanine ligase [Clostridiales bacterium]|nr:UDP-N-acetylmuramoyl-tripeptide--D-alanyl-D-alanine ligase [Clostridiales bacterium]